MSDDAYGATVAKRRLALRLTELRQASGHTANHVCDRLYDVSLAEREDLEHLAALARARPWWRDYSDVFENEYPGFENDASQIRTFMPLLLPGLLQTREYMEVILRAGSRPPSFVRRASEARLRRQEILDRTDGTAPMLSAVISEASLRYRWGPEGDRREQIDHLADLSRRPNVELRIQRFADGPPTGMHSMVNIFDLPGDGSRLVYLETDVAIHQVSKREEVDSYLQGFGRAQDGALEPSDTTAYLKYLSEQLE
jgi:Domain of unknown function (DUF5753)